MSYRADIDGLRAIAVLPVILLHAGFGLLPGGFLGVDVFFVISGYLITGILMTDLRGGTFSLVTFYERRARRILPALLVVMFVSTVLAYQLMLPEFLENFGQSLVATSLFANNVLLLLTSGYWDLESEFKPLLHTWSLGVEEQFYLLFPLLLLLLKRRTDQTIGLVIALLLLASLAASESLSRASPNAAFYLLPTRAWELLLGALMALHQKRFDAAVGRRGANVLSLTGAALLLVGYLALDHTVRMPALPSLLPTVGAALLLGFSRPGTASYAMLSTRPLVGIGLISYSAYLWHQPLFAFSRIAFKSHPGPLWFGAMVLLTLLLAWLTWRFVEQPVRRGTRISRPRLFMGLSGGSAAVLALGLLLHVGGGFPERLHSQAKVAAEDMYIQYNQRVHRLSKDRFETQSPVRMLVMGNSFARDFVNMVTETMPSDRLELIYRSFHYACLKRNPDPVISALIDQATVVVMASGDIDRNCFAEDAEWIEARQKQLFVIGTKHFGYNLNWVIQVPESQRANLTNDLLPDTIAKETSLRAAVPSSRFVALMEPVLRSDRMPITNEEGQLLSADRAHLTRQGARYFGERAIRPSALGVLVMGDDRLTRASGEPAATAGTSQ